MSLKLIDLYVYKMIKNRPLFLLLKRADEKIYSGQWRMIGGKVQEGEKRWDAAVRELEEETGLQPLKLWTIPSINHFYEHKSDRIHLIAAFASQVSTDHKITLDSEHTDSIWVEPDQISEYIYWPEQKKMISLINQLISSNQILEDWVIINNSPAE